MMRIRTCTILLATLLGGCVFRDASEPRFFRPQSTMLDAGDDAASTSAIPVRLQPVSGTPFLRERIVWRSSDVEYGMYEQRRWSELPASYVERAIASALRQTPGIRLTDDFRAPSLSVEVIAFDEVLAPAHVASVGVVVSLRDRERQRVLDRGFSAQSPITGDGAGATAAAMGRALDQVALDVATAVGKTLGAR